MTHYVGIDAMQEPFDMGLDDLGRPMFGFDVAATSRPSASFGADVATLLETAGVASRASGTLLVSSAASLPSTDNDAPAAFLAVRAVPGLAPLGTHNGGATAYRRPQATITATARTSAAAEALAHAAYSALAGRRALEIGA